MIIKLSCPLLNPMKWMMQMRLDSTGSTPRITSLTRKALDISSSLMANLTCILQNWTFTLQDNRKILRSPRNPFQQKVVLCL